jgi:hypothetical protein
MFFAAVVASQSNSPEMLLYFGLIISSSTMYSIILPQIPPQPSPSPLDENQAQNDSRDGEDASSDSGGFTSTTKQ